MPEDAWARIENWLKAHAPRVFGLLAGPATDEQIGLAEAEMDVVFPAEVRRVYLRHDGQKDDKRGEVAPPWEILSTTAMVQQWRMLKKTVRHRRLR